MKMFPLLSLTFLIAGLDSFAEDWPGWGGKDPGRNMYSSAKNLPDHFAKEMVNGKIDFNDYAGHGGRPPGSSFKPYTLATVLTQTLKQTPEKDHFAINSYVPGDYCRTIDGTKICNDPGDYSVSASRIMS